MFIIGGIGILISDQNPIIFILQFHREKETIMAN